MQPVSLVCLGGSGLEEGLEIATVACEETLSQRMTSWTPQALTATSTMLQRRVRYASTLPLGAEDGM